MNDVCACGCWRWSHRRVSMSVPLPPNPEPLYPIGDWNPIAKTYPQSTLEHEECRCGCCQYEPDA